MTVGSELSRDPLDLAKALKESYQRQLYLQVVALHMRGILDDEVERTAFQECCQHDGVDVVGGLPQAGCSDLEKYYELLFDISEASGKPIEVHTDELLAPGEVETGVFADVARRRRNAGYKHGLSVVHAASLSCHPQAERMMSYFLAERN